MEQPTRHYSGPVWLLFGIFATGCAWFAAFAIEASTRLMTGMFAQLGGDLPAPTLLTINAVQSHVPWIIAATSTLIIVYLGMRAGSYFLHACALVAVVAAVLASCVALALVLPLMKCGIAWPEWPQAASQSSGRSATAPPAMPKHDAARGAAAGSCR